MLTLERKLFESIMISNDVSDDASNEFEVKVLGLYKKFNHKTNKYVDVVKLGFNAPDNIMIWREEIYKKIILEKTFKSL